jgi:hypothetical protein
MMPGHRVLIRTALAIVLLAVIGHTRADPDLWGHVLFGKDIVSGGRIPETDAYSFMSDREWINHEWLAECAMYIAFAIGGAPGLVMLKMLVVLAMLALVWSRLGRRQVDTASRDLLIALTVIGTFPQANHVRPQIFSIVAFAVLMWILDSGGSVRRLLLIPLVFAAWVNFHGGWIVGGGVLALWAVLTAAGSSPGGGVSSEAFDARGKEVLPPRWWQGEKGLLFLVGAMAFIGTLANPYGWRMWLFLTSTVGFGRAEITDWQPLYRLGLGYVALWAVLALAAAIGAIHAWRSRAWELRRLGVVLMLGLASFQVSRLQAFFAIAVVLLLGRDIAAALVARRGAASPVARAPKRLATASAIIIAAALIAGGTVASARNLTCIRMGSDQAEPEVVAMAKQGQLHGRLVVWFDWGEYAIWHFAPALSVSIDGRRETVYTDRVMQKHLNFYYVPASREAFLAETRPDHIWLLADLPVVSTLLREGWQPLYRGPRSVWLSRDAASTLDRKAGASAPAVASEVGRRCFPGP